MRQINAFREGVIRAWEREKAQAKRATAMAPRTNRHGQQVTYTSLFDQLGEPPARKGRRNGGGQGG